VPAGLLVMAVVEKEGLPLTTAEVSPLKKPENLAVKVGLSAPIYRVALLAVIVSGAVEEAREKIYQDLLNKGDIEGAKAMRKYQDVVHPLKNDSQQPPSTPEPPPAP
jgi:hypothetical protein